MSTDKFTINNITIMNSWIHNLSSNVDCTICRCNLNTNSLYNQEKGIDSIIIKGACGHSFHNECIDPWIKKNNYCPICYSAWCKAESSNNIQLSNN